MDKNKILIIEDESGIADTIIYALKTEGMDPVWVSTGNDALSKLETDVFDLLIIDIGLPDMNGFELLKEIRRISNVPVIFLTARTNELDKVLGLELGADDYVTKPFSPRELTARIKANLRRSSESDFLISNNNEIFLVDDLKKEIKYYNKKVDLSFYEYKILNLLINSPGRVYSRDKIIELVWDDLTDIYDRTVDAHIKSIRSKLKIIKNDSDPIITHRGFGYSLSEDL